MFTPRLRSLKSPVFDAYPTRLMLGWILSLGLLSLLLHLPLDDPTNRVGWGSKKPYEQIPVSQIQPESSTEQTDTEGPVRDAPPSTGSQSAQSEQTVESFTSTIAKPDPSRTADSTQSRQSQSNKAHAVATLAPGDQRPEIVGGLGSLYLNIQYPEEARNQGIQGKLKLEFTVQTDGTVTDVRIIDSLHPLCDSAAVKGLRSVKFIPAKQNGDPVPVRMKLPVLFRLISTPIAPKTAEVNS